MEGRRASEGIQYEPRVAPRRRGLTWGAMVALLFAVAGGVAYGLDSPTGVAGPFKAPAGPPDTLRGTKLVVPRTPQLLKAAYLERAVAATSPRDSFTLALSDRYNVTRTLARDIVDAAMEAGIDPELAFRLIRVESVFKPDAVGAGGALGLTQLMFGTARDIDPRVKSRKEVMEPKNNMRLGFKNLRDMIERYDGDVRLGVIAYNRGEIAVDRAIRRGRDPENGYGERVLGPRAHGGVRYRGKGLLHRR